MDVLTPEQRKKNMRAIKSKNTLIEELLAKALWQIGLKYRRNNAGILGKPDFTFRKQKIAIFCDSEFFHGKDWDMNKNRIKTNTDFWHKKIEGNIRRDLFVNENLQKSGWRVIRFWGKDIKANLDECVRIILVELKGKMINYSEIRKLLKIEPEKEKDDSLANFTHYLQTQNSEIESYYQSKAVDYVDQMQISKDSVCELNFQPYLPIKWDIPFPVVDKPLFTFIDLFAGIGGIRLAFQRQKGKCVFSSEWDKFAKKTYEANFGEVPFGDITKITEDDIPEHDILLAGFPCQPFSIAGVSKKNSLGKSHGFLDETQGTLFFDVARIIKNKRPKAFMLENVKNLLSHDKGKTFFIINKTLEELNYSVKYKILDGKAFVPQHRERIIIVGFDKNVFKEQEKFQFPEMVTSEHSIRKILEDSPDVKYTLTDKLWNYLQNYAIKHKAKGNGFGFGLTDINGISRTLSARYYKDGSEILIPQADKNPRRLTPRECARLMGYPDTFLIPVSDNQAYRQFGNSVIVPLIESVAKNIVKELLYE